MACSSFHAGYLPTTGFPTSLVNLLSVIWSSTTGRTLTPQFTRRLVAYGQKCLDLAGICHNPYTLLCAVLRQLGVLTKHRNSVIDEIQTFWDLNTMVLARAFDDIFFHIPI